MLGMQDQFLVLELRSHMLVGVEGGYCQNFVFKTEFAFEVGNPITELAVTEAPRFTSDMK